MNPDTSTLTEKILATELSPDLKFFSARTTRGIITFEVRVDDRSSDSEIQKP